jgi:hypothetical protein
MQNCRAYITLGSSTNKRQGEAFLNKRVQWRYFYVLKSKNKSNDRSNRQASIKNIYI